MLGSNAATEGKYVKFTLHHGAHVLQYLLGHEGPFILDNLFSLVMVMRVKGSSMTYGLVSDNRAL